MDDVLFFEDTIGDQVAAEAEEAVAEDNVAGGHDLIEVEDEGEDAEKERDADVAGEEIEGEAFECEVEAPEVEVEAVEGEGEAVEGEGEAVEGEGEAAEGEDEAVDVAEGDAVNDLASCNAEGEGEGEASANDIYTEAAVDPYGGDREAAEDGAAATEEIAEAEFSQSKVADAAEPVESSHDAGMQSASTQKGKGKGKNKGKGQDGGAGVHTNEFWGFVYQIIPATKTLLIKCGKVEEEFEHEAVIPSWNNQARVQLGDKIAFDVEELVQEGEGAPRPMATNVHVRERGTEAKKKELMKGNALTDVRTQVLYYLSDDNLRRDRFFQDIIASSKGGWIGVSSILGCRRMKQLGASIKSIVEALRGATDIEVRETVGQEAVRRKRPPPPLDGAGPTPSNTKASPSNTKASAKVSGKPDASEAGRGSVLSSAETFYAGVVTNQARHHPRKLFISCEAVTESYGHDAFFLPNQKPAQVEVGSLIVFTLHASAQKDRSPQAAFVAELAPLGPSVLEHAASHGDADMHSAPSRKRAVDGSFK